jgi:malonyl-CoA decarboxylase
MRFALFRSRAEAPSALDQAIALSERLLGPGGEAEGTALATRLAAACRGFDGDERLAYFHWLVDALAPPVDALASAARCYLAQPSVANAASLTSAAEPRRQQLLRRLNTAPGGTALVVGLRAQLLGALAAHPALMPLEDDLRHLLGSWFNRGFLELRRIDWQSPAAILEKLIAYEAVHAISGWNDLRSRLADDRRCYGFFHPALPGEPLIFVEVALTQEISAAIAPLLDERRDVSGPPPSAAIFYSISNCQPGLRGVSFGNLLIKQITMLLAAEFPSLGCFATLSPVPGFQRWLDRHRLSADTPAELKRLCARYLTTNRLVDADASPDPVAHFHLSNGARLERVNLGADLSEKGLAQSRGTMVNYRYDRESIDRNMVTYARDGTVARSTAVNALL